MLEVSEVLELLNPKIKSSLKQTSYQDREDLEQEIKLKILQHLDNVNKRDIPNFFSFLNEDMQ